MTQNDTTPPTGRSALALAGLIRRGKVSARAVVEAHISVLQRWQPKINAIAVERFEDARAEADAADDRVASAAPDDQLPLLLGVPCTIKETLNVSGLPHTAGLLGRKHVRAASTATAAQRVLDAGAILLGLTNTAELAMWFETENPVYGRTSNPYDPGRTAGGSSGGCAAAVGCGGVPISLGTDIGGSIRVPAFCCGVFGHKPSVGVVPQTFDYPAPEGEAKWMLSMGPLARRAEDLMPMMRILAGPDGLDPLVEETELGDPADVSLQGMRVLLSERCFMGRISPQLLEAREQAARALAGAGARIERVELPQMRRMLEPTLATLSDGGTTTLASVLIAGGVEPLTLGDVLAGGDRHTVPLRLWSLADRLSGLTSSRRMARMLTRGREFATELASTIGDGVLLHPPLPTLAPKHRRTYGRVLFFQPTGIFNLAGLPVTQVPLGLSRGGLPLGVQVAAGPRRDHAAIAVAMALEQAFGGWSPPAWSALATTGR
jgi:Asp-tRNA(Asn)/Glu-tRNA(Gln) amidotransferase A subunit family amidase